ncbi:hypothetical protein O3M35_005100 [Rhynocoris fuscipes]|uniref:Uncharacterized protein n=1 Tax=Rhynocoris fuscipes TaxID=488301 RepID=A0AAW1DMY1_9HEMI
MTSLYNYLNIKFVPGHHTLYHNIKSSYVITILPLYKEVNINYIKALIISQ